MLVHLCALLLCQMVYVLEVKDKQYIPDQCFSDLFACRVMDVSSVVRTVEVGLSCDWGSVC